VIGPSGEQMSEFGMDANNKLAWQHSNVYAAGKLLATYDADGLHYYLDDPLGSRRVQTDYAGVLEQSCASLPFGDNLACSGSTQYPTEHHFTGKERDAESGLDYFGARYYASSLARFMSPDWSAKIEPVPYSKLDDPQTLNLYAYVQNNPLASVDPDGHGDLEAGGQQTWLDEHQSQIEANDDPCKGNTNTCVVAAAQQQSSSGPGFWERLRQRFNNFFHSDGFVTNAELEQVHGEFTSFYIVPDSVHEVDEPNPYITMGLDAAGIGATLTVTLPPECVPLNVLVLGDIYPRGRRGGGSVEIAPAISKG